MELKFMPSSVDQKISALEKEQKVIQETLRASSIAFGTKLLNDASAGTARQFVTEELLTSWMKDVQERKNCTDTILNIKNILERQEQLKTLIAEANKMIASKDKEIQKLKDSFALSAYQNHRDEFADALERIPEISQLEEQIEHEKNKIETLSTETAEKTGFFDKIMPGVKTMFSKNKVNSAENKLKKVVQQQSGALFSDADFENLYTMTEELPTDLCDIIANLKMATETRLSASSKISELEAETKANNEKLSSLDALSDSKKKIASLMEKIKGLDAKIENTAFFSCEKYVNNFFDNDGETVSSDDGENPYENQVNNIGALRRKCFNADIAIGIAKCENEIDMLNGKISFNTNRIERNKKQVENLTNEITADEAANADLQLSLSDFTAKVDSLKSQLKTE